MEVKVVEKAEILIPNPPHKSFSGSNSFIPKDSILEGEATLVSGKRRGSPFKYRLFKTNDKKYIFLDKIKPIKITKEQNSNASGDMGKAIIVNTSAGRTSGKVPLAFALIGGGAGYAYCKYKAHDSKNTWKYVLAGALLGYVAGRLLQDGKVISVSESK